MKIDKKGGGLVYSTDRGKMCPSCRQPIGQCTCCLKKPTAVSDGIVRVSRQTSGRNGKSVTVVKGLALDSDALTRLGKQFKAACGSGGTVKDGAIEIQGDHCERVIATLGEQGWVVKRAGG